jgi:hypothetical protein
MVVMSGSSAGGVMKIEITLDLPFYLRLEDPTAVRYSGSHEA